MSFTGKRDPRGGYSGRGTYTLWMECDARDEECYACDGVGWTEGGVTLQTGCEKCDGTGALRCGLSTSLIAVDKKRAMREARQLGWALGHRHRHDEARCPKHRQRKRGLRRDR